MPALADFPFSAFEPLIRAALDEDLGYSGDITTDRIVPIDAHANASLVARQPGRIAGLEIARLAFHLLDKRIDFKAHVEDGDAVIAGQSLATITGPARGILSAERVALNFLCHLSGIATATAALVAAVKHTHAKVTCTRKTNPGLRALEKYAVAMGGGVNHRFGLGDAILIKDNHIAIAGGVTEAIARATSDRDPSLTVEVEVDTLAQLHEVLSTTGIDIVLLDNMRIDQLKEAVALVDGKLITEASGGVTLDTIARIAETGIDRIAVGWITHSAPILDIGLDFSS